MLRMIPIVKLPLDLFLYDFTKWSYSHGVDPLLCATGTRTLSVMLGWISPSIDRSFLPMNSGIQFSVPGDMTFTVADVIGRSMNPLFLKCLMVGVLLGSAYFLIKKLTEYKHFAALLHFSAKAQQNKKIRNFSLKHSLKKSQIQSASTS